MGLSFRRLLLFEGLFEVASLGRVARSPDFCLPLFQCRGEGERKTPPPPASHYLFNLLCPPPLPPSLSKRPQALLRFPPPTGRRKGGPLPSFFSNLPAVSRRQDVAFLLGPLSFQASLGLRESRGTGVLEALEMVGWSGTSGISSAPR